jgi:spectrin beta
MTFALLSSIDERRNQVVARRAAVKEAAAARQAALYASRKFHNFSADVDDLRGWMVDKLKTATDESYRDLTNLERKLQKHAAFERELHANEGQLRAVNKESIRDSIILGSTRTKGSGFDHLVSCNMKIAEN